MQQSPGKKLTPLRKSLIGLAALSALFLLVTLTPLGLWIGFPPSIGWFHRLNRREYDRHQERYRGMAAIVKRDMAGVKPGEALFYSLESGELRRVERDPVLFRRLTEQGFLVEAFRYEREFGVRFLTRRPWSGGQFSLIYWDPQPCGGLIWGGTPWCDLQMVDWIDSRWWSAYQPHDVNRVWLPGRWQFGLRED